MDITLLKRIKFFAEFNAELLEEIAQHCTLIELPIDSYLFKEGDTPRDIYFLLEGLVDVIKYDETDKHEHVIANLHPGETIGEMAILEPDLRSASIKAKLPSKCIAVNIDKLNKLIHATKSDQHFTIWQRLVANVVKRLKQANQDKVVALKKEINILNMRIHNSMFITYIISLLCIFIFISGILQTKLIGLSSSTYITLPLIIIIFLLCIPYFIKYKYKIGDLGISKTNLKTACLESFIFTIPLIIITTIFKYLLVKNVPAFQHLPVFDLLQTSTVRLGSFHKALQQLLILDTSYIFIIVPIQELIARGVLQHGFEKFLVGKHKYAMAIIVSNLIFAVYHVFMGIYVALATFIGGLYFGWLYYRHRNIISPILAHVILGFWFMSVLNFSLIITV